MVDRGASGITQSVPEVNVNTPTRSESVRASMASSAPARAMSVLTTPPSVAAPMLQ